MIQNKIQETTKLNTVFLPLSRVGGTYTSTAVDGRSEARCEAGMAVFHVGDDAGGASGLAGTIKLFDSADNSTFGSAIATYTITALPTAAGWVIEIPFSPAALRRYRKWELILTFTGGTTPAVPCSGIEILSNPMQVPLS